MNDKIADMLIRIKNAGTADKESTLIPHSKLKASIAEALLKKGYITSVSSKGKKTKKVIWLPLPAFAKTFPCQRT